MSSATGPVCVPRSFETKRRFTTRPARIASSTACGPAIGSPASCEGAACARGPAVMRRTCSLYPTARRGPRPAPIGRPPVRNPALLPCRKPPAAGRNAPPGAAGRAPATQPGPRNGPPGRRCCWRRSYAATPRAHRAPARPWSRSFAAVALPALAVLRVLHAYAKSLPQIVAQLVRSLEVLVLAGLFALGEQTLRLFGQRRCLARALLDREPEH